MPGAQFTNLTPGTVIRGTMILEGTAAAEDFVLYVLEIRPLVRSGYTLLGQYTTPVETGPLGELDVSGFEAGAYVLRLRIVSTGGATAMSCAIPVTIQR